VTLLAIVLLQEGNWWGRKNCNKGGTLMILVQIATALAIGAYVVLSKDAQHRRLDATPTQGKHHAGSAALMGLFSVGAALPIVILGYFSRSGMMSDTVGKAPGDTGLVPPTD
jgi:hypothetical protein